MRLRIVKGGAMGKFGRRVVQVQVQVLVQHRCVRA